MKIRRALQYLEVGRPDLHIKGENGQMSIVHAPDIDKIVSLTLPYEGDDLQVVVRSDKFAQLVRSIKNPTRIAANDDQLILSSDDEEARIGRLNDSRGIESFVHPKMQWSKIDVTGERLRVMARFAANATGARTSALERVQIEGNGKRLRMVGTDGFKLAIAETDSANHFRSFTLDRRTTLAIGQDENAQLEYAEIELGIATRTTFDVKGMRVEIFDRNRPEIRYPDYKTMVENKPYEFITLKMNRNDLRSSIVGMSRLTEGSVAPMKMTKADDSIGFKKVSKDTSDCTWKREIPAQTESPSDKQGATTCIDGNLILNLLGSFPDDLIVRMNRDRVQPLLITGKRGEIDLSLFLMPLRESSYE